jgi:hypothetical protein
MWTFREKVPAARESSRLKIEGRGCLSEVSPRKTETECSLSNWTADEIGGLRQAIDGTRHEKRSSMF